MKLRRLLALILIVLGAVFLWVAPESIGGVILIAVGIGIEVLGIVLARRF